MIRCICNFTKFVFIIFITIAFSHGQESNFDKYKVIALQIGHYYEEKKSYSVKLNDGEYIFWDKSQIIGQVNKIPSKSLTIVYNGGNYRNETKELLLEIQKMRNDQKNSGVITKYINSNRFKNKSQHNLIYESTDINNEYLKVGEITIYNNENIENIFKIGISHGSIGNGVFMTSSETALGKKLIDKLKAEKIPVFDSEMKLIFSSR